MKFGVVQAWSDVPLLKPFVAKSRDTRGAAFGTFCCFCCCCTVALHLCTVYYSECNG